MSYDPSRFHFQLDANTFELWLSYHPAVYEDYDNPPGSLLAEARLRMAALQSEKKIADFVVYEVGLQRFWRVNQRIACQNNLEFCLAAGWPNKIVGLSLIAERRQEQSSKPLGFLSITPRDGYEDIKWLSWAYNCVCANLIAAQIYTLPHRSAFEAAWIQAYWLDENIENMPLFGNPSVPKVSLKLRLSMSARRLEVVFGKLKNSANPQLVQTADSRIETLLHKLADSEQCCNKYVSLLALFNKQMFTDNLQNKPMAISGAKNILVGVGVRRRLNPSDSLLAAIPTFFLDVWTNAIGLHELFANDQLMQDYRFRLYQGLNDDKKQASSMLWDCASLVRASGLSKKVFALPMVRNCPWFGTSPSSRKFILQSLTYASNVLKTTSSQDREFQTMSLVVSARGYQQLLDHLTALHARLEALSRHNSDSSMICLASSQVVPITAPSGEWEHTTHDFSHAPWLTWIVREILTLPFVEHTADSIVKTIIPKVTKKAVIEALKKLCELKLVTPEARTGKFMLQSPNILTGQDIVAKNLKEFHASMIKLTLDYLNFSRIPIKLRSASLILTKETFKEAKQIIRSHFAEIFSLTSGLPQSDSSLYQVSFQLVPVWVIE